MNTIKQQLKNTLQLLNEFETEIFEIKINIELDTEPVIEIETDTCYLCLEDLDTNKNFISYCCGHKTHFTCFVKNNSLSENPDNCGYCRQKLVSDEIKEEIRAVKRQSLIDERRRNQEYMNELRRENNIAELPIRRQMLVDSDSDSDSEVILQELPVPVRVVRPRRIRPDRRMNRRVVESRNLVRRGLNEETYLTIPEIRTQIQSVGSDLSEATISTRIREFISENQVEVGSGGGNRRNYRLVRNHERHQ